MLKENAGQKTQLTYRKFKLLITKNFQSHFKVTLTIHKIKPTWRNTFSKKWRDLLPYISTSCQTIYLANLDGAIDRATSQSSERTDFYCDHDEADKKIFPFIKFFCDKDISSFVWTGSSLFCQTLMWRLCLYIKMSLTLHF